MEGQGPEQEAGGSDAMSLREFVGVLIQNAQAETLVIDHFEGGREGLNYPGGKVDPGESPEQAAMRETWEEVGVHVSDLKLISEGEHTFHGETWRGYYYLARTRDGVPVNREPTKHRSVAFRSRDQIERGAERPFVVELLDLAARARDSGFIARNDPRLIIVPNWAEFAEWAKDAGYGEADLDVNDSRCMHLQETYLEESGELAAYEGSQMVGA